MSGEKTLNSSKLGEIIELRNVNSEWNVIFWVNQGKIGNRIVNSTNFNSNYIAANVEYEKMKRDIVERENQIIAKSGYKV